MTKKKKYEVTVFKYSVPTPKLEDMPGKVFCKVIWIHPDDISKVNISDVPHLAETLEGNEFIFLLYRNLMLEAGYVPRVLNYELKKDATWQEYMKNNNVTMYIQEDDDWTKALDDKRKVRVQTIKDSITINNKK